MSAENPIYLIALLSLKFEIISEFIWSGEECMSFMLRPVEIQS
jgi:hypothetical protein